MRGVPIALGFTIQTIGPLRLPVGQITPVPDQPLVPGATVKGAARRSAEIIAAVLGLAPCLRDGDAQCPLCRIFGAPGVAGPVHWSAAEASDGTPITHWPDVLDARRRHPIDRALGLSSGVSLPTRTALPEGLHLSANARGWLSGDGRADAALLAASLRQLHHLAGGKGAGFGRVSVSVNSLILAGASQDIDALVDSLIPQEVA